MRGVSGDDPDGGAGVASGCGGLRPRPRRPGTAGQAVTAGAARLARRDPVLPDGDARAPRDQKSPRWSAERRAHRSQGARRAQPARHNNKEHAPVGAPPPPRGWLMKEASCGPEARCEAQRDGEVRLDTGAGGEFCPAHERWLFDSVNRGSTASRRFASRGDAAHCLWNGPGSAVHRSALARSTLHCVRDTAPGCVDPPASDAGAFCALSPRGRGQRGISTSEERVRGWLRSVLRSGPLTQRDALPHL
jgi:hypothetical protein